MARGTFSLGEHMNCMSRHNPLLRTVMDRDVRCRGDRRRHNPRRIIARCTSVDARCNFELSFRSGVPRRHYSRGIRNSRDGENWLVVDHPLFVLLRLRCPHPLLFQIHPLFGGCWGRCKQSRYAVAEQIEDSTSFGRHALSSYVVRHFVHERTKMLVRRHVRQLAVLRE